MNAQQITLRRAVLDEILTLRHRILRAGLPIETAHFPGDDAMSSIHLGAFTQNGACVGCATLHLNQFDAQPAYQLRGMAVDDSYRSQGIGTRLLAEIDSIALAANILVLWCNARTPAAAFYTKHGWQIISEEFQIPAAGPHFKMTRQLQHVSQ